MIKRLSILPLMLMVLSCLPLSGCGNSSGNNNFLSLVPLFGSPNPAPRHLSYATPAAVYTINVAITNNEPTVTGTVTSWSVGPSLPAGLSLNTSTGEIAGTPTSLQSATTYTVTATNSYGSTTAKISIAVNSPLVIDFETGNTTQCDSTAIGGSDALTVSTSNAIHGSYSLKYVSGGSSVSTYAEKTFTPQTAVYARCYFYITSVFSAEYQPMMFLFGLYDSSGTAIATIGITGDFAPYRLLVPYYIVDGGGYSKGDEGTISSGLHCAEIYYATGSGTGAYSLYLDGMLWYSATGLSNSTRVPDRVRVGAVPFEGCQFDSGSTLYFDDIQVSSSYIGLYGLVLRENQPSGSGGLVRVGADSTTKYLSSSFTASSSYSLSAVNIKLNNQASSTSNLHLYLYSDDGSGSPSALLATATNTVNTATIPTGGGLYYPMLWTFNDYALTGGTKYHIVMMIDNAGGSAQIGILCAGVSGQNIKQDADGTAPFAMTYSNSQFCFQTYSK